MEKIPLKIRPDEAALFQAYTRDISHNSLLTHQQEAELTARASAGDFAAKEKLANANLRLVIAIAKNFAVGKNSLMDMIQDGNLGLLKAVERFDPSFGIKFSTYATWWIRQSITRGIANTGRTVRIPVYAIENTWKMFREEHALEQKTGREVSDAEIAAYLGISESEVDGLRRIAQETISLDTPLSSDSEETFGDLIACADPSPEEEVERRTIASDIQKALQQLAEKERTVLIRRFGLGGHSQQTLGEIGDSLCLTRERIRQIEESAKRKIRESPSCSALRDYI